MTPRPRVVVVAPHPMVGALRERAPGIEIDGVALPDLVEHVTRHRPEVVVVAGRPVDGVIETLRALREGRRDLRLILVTCEATASIPWPERPPSSRSPGRC